MRAIFVVMTLALMACQSEPKTTDRWVTTENTAVEIDFDAVGKAYKSANGPEDFERRVNEIYTGSEIISVAVQDESAKVQVVTGFFDKDKDGAVGEGEKIFSLKRQIDSGTGSGNYRIQGHGHYSHYHSPMWDIASGMMLGSMLSSAFAPDYRPVYVQHNTYTTSPTRARAIRTNRASYRKANPAKFNSKPRRLTTKSSAKPSKNKVKKSKSKRNYGSKGNKWGSRPSTRRRTGGSKFGTRRRREKVIRLEA